MARSVALIVLMMATMIAADSAVGQDVIEFLSGARLEGKVAGIDKTAREVTFAASIAGRSSTRTYPYNKIHAVTFNGKRYVLTEKTDASGGVAAADSGASSTQQGRAAADVRALIEQMGKTRPDWYDDTPLNFPKTLDLSWPEKPTGPWNPQKNIGQYNWDVINPNPNKWREGVVFLHHLLDVNRSNPDIMRRVMNSLGLMYFNLHQDYARAAFWWQMSGIDKGTSPYHQSGPHLAACYYKLGNKQMAVALLNKLPPTYDLIKVWAEVGELDTALKLAGTYARAQNGAPDIAYMMAGDACRTAGRYQQAIGYYEQVLKVPDAKRTDRNKKRAREALDAIKFFELCDVRKVPDGKYTSSAQGYEAAVEVEVVVSNKQIETVRVTKHREKQFYSSITDTTANIIAKQGVKGVDATSNATITSEAIINATAKALAGAADN
ncbi:MAG: FMN-binding protein [Pirellulaceae bacterium]